MADAKATAPSVDRMMLKRGVDAYAARRLDVGLAFIEARAKSAIGRTRCRRRLTMGRHTSRISAQRCIFPDLLRAD
jgi:hypothetical protein